MITHLGSVWALVAVRLAETSLGFPSIHATLVTAVALTVMPYVSWFWRIALTCIIIAVCLSRVYAGVHLPLDVMAGVALGTAAVALVRLTPQSLRVLLRID